MKTFAALVVAAAIVVSGCSLAQAPTSRPTFPPRPTLAPPPTLPPDATPLPTLAACSGAPAAPTGETVVTLTDFPLAGALEVVDVTWTGTRFVAVGFGALPGEGYEGPRQGYVWTSCDGQGWQELIDPTFLYVSPISVAALGDDVYVLGSLSTCGPLYSEECEDVAEAGNVVLRSTNGGSWQRLSQDQDIQLGYDLKMVAVNGQLAVHGTADDDNATQTLWLSGDGVNWQATTDVAGMDPIDAIAAWGNGLLAFGTSYTDDFEDSTLVVATSADGQRFNPVAAPNPPGATVLDVTQGAAGYAAVGVGYPDADDFGTLGVVLHSTDGTTWSEGSATDGSLVDGQLDGVHAIDGVYAAVGYTYAADDFTTQQGTIWRSSDGRSWSRLTQFGSTASVFTTSAASPTGLVIFSADEDLSGEEVVGTVSAYFVPTTALTP